MGHHGDDADRVEHERAGHQAPQLLWRDGAARRPSARGEDDRHREQEGEHELCEKRDGHGHRFSDTARRPRKVNRVAQTTSP